MSPVKRPSSVEGLRRGVAAPAAPPAAAQDNGDDAIARQLARVQHHTERTKPVRVSLDLDPDLYHGLTQWAQSAASSIGAVRVTNADALRAMIRACVDDPMAKDYAITRLREHRGQA